MSLLMLLPKLHPVSPSEHDLAHHNACVQLLLEAGCCSGGMQDVDEDPVGSVRPAASFAVLAVFIQQRMFVPFQIGRAEAVVNLVVSAVLSF